jgi:hypothetical protein
MGERSIHSRHSITHSLQSVFCLTGRDVGDEDEDEEEEEEEEEEE